MDWICKKELNFKNPKKLPLNQLLLPKKTIKHYKKITKDMDLEKISKDIKKYLDVNVENISALDATWLQDKFTYHEYQPYFFEVPKEENEQFLAKNKLFIDSLKYILERSYHQFWCLLLFEPKIPTILDSFIQNPISVYELKHLDNEFLNVCNTCCDLVARIYIRMLAFYESETEYMSEDTVVQYLLENNIITYPKIVNISAVFNNINRKLVNKIIEVFFDERLKKLYNPELKKLMQHSLSVFEIIGGQICGFDEKIEAMPLYIRKKPINFDPYWFEEVSSFLLDTALNLNAFFSSCKPALEVAFTSGIPFRLSYFYNRVYHELYNIMKKKHTNSVPFNWERLKERIYELLSSSRMEFVSIYHSFVADKIDKILQSVGNNKQQEEYIEEYFKLVTTALEDEYFIFDYHNFNAIDVQAQMLGEMCPEIDVTRINYILECLGTLPNCEELLKPKIKAPIKEKTPQPCLSSNSISTPPNNNTQKSSIVPSENELQKLINSVLDTLPHLGDGFVLKCLEHYNYDTSEVISAILDENLPPHLLDIPPDMIRIPDEPKPAPPLLAYRGKKPGFSDANALLNDKTDIEATKDFVLKKSMVTFDLYDDDYDDRDDIEATTHFYERNEEPDVYKYMVNRFDNCNAVSDPSDSSEEEDDNNASSRNPNYNKGTSGSNSRDNRSNFQAFCEDPAAIREKREANRRHHQGGNRDVVGKPKGQGQDAKVLQNREKKNVNKSSRANHNRKSGAQFKRNKGMFPS